MCESSKKEQPQNQKKAKKRSSTTDRPSTNLSPLKAHDQARARVGAAHQQRFAESILGGVKRYFAQNPPLARARVG